MRAACRELLASRRRVVVVLQALGAVVVEAPPEALGPAVWALSEVKQHARL